MNINKYAIPNEWQAKAIIHIDTLVQAFQETNIFNPVIYAYACASISHESSWNPWAENKTDRAARKPYSGKGLAQVTLQSNYQKISNFTRINFIGNPYLMFDPYLSLRAKAAYFVINQMISFIRQGDFESAAGIYNAGKANYRSAYTQKVAHDTPRWFPVFLVQSNNVSNFSDNINSGFSGNRSLAAIRVTPPTLAAIRANPPQLNIPRSHTKVSLPVSASPRVYTVRSGDNFYAIARRFGLPFNTLLANNPQISNPSQIQIGDKLIIAS